MTYEKYRKIAVVGYPGVGKTAMTEQFLNGNFPTDYSPTIYNQVTKPDYRINDERFFVEVIDTAGYNEYSTAFLSCWSLASSYGFVLVYAIDSHKSFEVCRDISERIFELTGSADTPLLLVGNKRDLAAENQREVTLPMGEKLAKTLRNADFLEISAKNTAEVLRVFHKLLLRVDQERRAKKMNHNNNLMSCTIS